LAVEYIKYFVNSNAKRMPNQLEKTFFFSNLDFKIILALKYDICNLNLSS
jgi:hypothetical protein